MCLAIPGKIMQIKNSVATIDYVAEKRTARIVAGNFKKGDYVIVTGKVVVEKVGKKAAQKWLKQIASR